jgi:hypothetical protein
MDSTDIAYCSTDKEWLDDVNSRGLGGPDRVSIRWVEVIKHPDRNEWAAIIPDRYTERLGEVVTSQELSEKITAYLSFSQMRDGGWISE